jgi:hypothetical protein
LIACSLADSVCLIIWETACDDGTKEGITGCIVYGFLLEDHVPADHLLRSIDRFVELDGIRAYLTSFYSSTGRPSVDPELMMRMLLVGYIMGIRSKRRLCEESLPEPGLSLVLPIASDGWRARPFDLLEEPARPFQGQRCVPADIRGFGCPLYQ